MRPKILQATGHAHKNAGGHATINCCCDDCQYGCCVEISEGVFDCQTMPVEDCLAISGRPLVRYGWGHTIIDGKACCDQTEECIDRLGGACYEDEDCGTLSYPGCQCCDPPAILPDTLHLSFPAITTAATSATWLGGFPCPGMNTPCYRNYIDLWAGMLASVLGGGVTLVRANPLPNPPNDEGCGYSGVVGSSHSNPCFANCGPSCSNCNSGGSVSATVTLNFFDGACGDGSLRIVLRGATSGGAIQYEFMDETFPISANTDCDWASLSVDVGDFPPELTPADGSIGIEL